jgi:hypothetical protein
MPGVGRVVYTVDFEAKTMASCLDGDGERRRIMLPADGLTFDTMLVLSWYIENSTEKSFEPRLLQVLGRHLFEFLFPPSQSDRGWREGFIAACRRSEVLLRLQFGPGARQYAQLPWEFLVVPKIDKFLVEIGKVSVTLTRYLETQPLVTRCEDELRLLVHVSSPPSKATITSDLLERGLEKLKGRAGSGFDFRVEHNGDWDKIKADINEFEPHVFHFSGHGERDALWLAGPAQDRAFGEGAFDRTRQTRLPLGFGVTVAEPAVEVGIDGVVRLFEDVKRKPQLVVLDACNSDWSYLSEMLPGVAHQLVRVVPAVIAMRYPIDNGDADQFAVSLYEAILEGRPLDESVQVARYGLLQVEKGLASRAFGTPVLYLREAGPICREIIVPDEIASNPTLPTSTAPLSRNCPRCGGEGLWAGRRCTRCRVWFRCRNPGCNAKYTDKQIVSLRGCCDCDEDYTDTPSWPPTSPRDST